MPYTVLEKKLQAVPEQYFEQVSSFLDIILSLPTKNADMTVPIYTAPKMFVYHRAHITSEIMTTSVPVLSKIEGKTPLKRTPND
jgi:hypothetical protein